MNNGERLARLLQARHCGIQITTFDEQDAVDLVRSQCSAHLWMWTHSEGVRDALLSGERPVADTTDPAAALYYLTRRIEHPACCVTCDLGSHLGHARVRRLLRDLLEHFRAHGSTMVLIDPTADLPAVIQASVTPFRYEHPDRGELERLVRAVIRREHEDQPLEVALSRRQLDTMVRNLSGLSRRQAEQAMIDTVAHDRRLDVHDINTVLAHKRQVLQRDTLLDYVEAPVDLDEVGGLTGLKRWLALRKPALSDAARNFGIRPPRGLLLLGVQGAGKSLCAKAIATGWQRPLLRVDPGVLYDRFVGESERRLRDALHQVERMAPNVVWVDEIEKGFASAASRSIDGGLSQRLFGTLLTWMQEHAYPVFMVATANDIDALPPELLRRGRFDEIFFVDLPGPAARAEIVAIHLRLRARNPQEFDVAAIARQTPGFSGAELVQVLEDALLEAFSAEQTLVTADLIAAAQRTRPLSVTMGERIAQLRAWAATRCAPAGDPNDCD